MHVYLHPSIKYDSHYLWNGNEGSGSEDGVKTKQETPRVDE